jgi:hypothetical protein
LQDCKREKDYRGFVQGKGWAHAAAHIFDALDECVRSRYIGLEECKLVWSGLYTLLENAPEVFNSEEDERIATAVAAMVELGKVPLSVICEWLMDVKLPGDNDINQGHMRVNFKHDTWIFTKKARRTEFVIHKGTDPSANKYIVSHGALWSGITKECKGIDPLSRGRVNRQGNCWRMRAEEYHLEKCSTLFFCSRMPKTETTTYGDRWQMLIYSSKA